MESWNDYPSVEDASEEELPAHIVEWNAWWWNNTFHSIIWAQYLPVTKYLNRPKPSPIAEDNIAA